MIAILTQENVFEFLNSKSQIEYAENCEYISIIEITNIYKDLYAMVDWYSIFEKRPLYLTILRNYYWYKNHGDLSTNLFRLCNWKTVPTSASKDMIKSVPYEERMWKDDKYFMEVAKMLKGKLIKNVNGISILLDGNMNEIHEIKAR